MPLTPASLAASALGAFGLLAIVLAMIGVYGSMAYATFGITAVLVGAVAVLAALVPARRALSIDPASALRDE